MRTSAERVRTALAAQDERAGAHRARDNRQLASPARTASARVTNVLADAALLGDVVVVAVHRNFGDATTGDLLCPTPSRGVELPYGWRHEIADPAPLATRRVVGCRFGRRDLPPDNGEPVRVTLLKITCLCSTMGALMPERLKNFDRRHLPTLSVSQNPLDPDGTNNPKFAQSRKIFLYRPNEAKARERRDRTERTHTFAKFVLATSKKMSGPVPYIFRLANGNPTSLDWGCVGMLFNADPCELTFVTNESGFVTGVLPTSHLRTRYTSTNGRKVPGRAAPTQGVTSDIRLKFEARTRAALTALEVAAAQGEMLHPPRGSRTPSIAEVTAFRPERDEKVAAWVRFVAAGFCEACKSPAPFLDMDGMPFLEVHHVRQLSEGGPDQTDNAVAVCPNCHRRLHSGQDRTQFRAMLFGQVRRLRDYRPT